VRPSYNARGERKGRFCGAHKLPGMVDVKHRTCEQDGCELHPVFNARGERKGRFCGAHKLPGMVNVVNPTCEHDGCEVSPVFNARGERKGRFCAAHKLPGMVNVVNPPCEYGGCEVLPSYNVRGERKGRFCVSHKLDGMVDVVNRTCEREGCDKQPGFGVPGRVATRCHRHQEPGMIRNPRSFCTKPLCREVATFGVRTANHCELHAHPEERRLLGDVCVRCGLVDLLDDEGQCPYCDPQVFRRVRLAKQREVKVALDCSAHDDYDIYDEVVADGCGKERPDFAWDCGTHWVVLEVDEKQHKDRQEVCECVRMVNVAQSFGGVPVVFVRYNPDEFRGSRDVSVKNRISVLLGWLQHLRREPPANFLSFVQLFYDGYEESATTLVPVLEFEREVSPTL